jgi:L-ascorbate metabolism protein UlaG (beta-lactamase superfamily)
MRKDLLPIFICIALVGIILAKGFSRFKLGETLPVPVKNTLIYQGNGSIRITTPEGRIIYIDPWDGNAYTDMKHLIDATSFRAPADLVLETHEFSAYSKTDKEENVYPFLSKNMGFRVITCEKALEVIWDFSNEKEPRMQIKFNTFDLGYAKIEAAEGYNRYHRTTESAGYIISLSNGIVIYVSGEASTLRQMEALSKRKIDYAFFCYGSVWTMDEAVAAARLVNARNSIPYRMDPANIRNPELFDRSQEASFDVENRLLLAAGEEISLK